MTRRAERDDAEFTAFVQRDGVRLRALARSLTTNQADADDLLQETLIKTLVGWRRVRETAAPTAYARRIMVNEFVSGRRRRSSTELPSDDPTRDDRAGTDDTDALVDRHDLIAQVRQLPERARAVVVLRYLEDLPYREIAKLLRISEASARKTCERSLATLRTGVTAG